MCAVIICIFFEFLHARVKMSPLVPCVWKLSETMKPSAFCLASKLFAFLSLLSSVVVSAIVLVTG